jgi:hypothetical protein
MQEMLAGCMDASPLYDPFVWDEADNGGNGDGGLGRSNLIDAANALIEAAANGIIHADTLILLTDVTVVDPVDTESKKVILKAETILNIIKDVLNPQTPSQNQMNNTLREIINPFFPTVTPYLTPNTPKNQEVITIIDKIINTIFDVIHPKAP